MGFKGIIMESAAISLVSQFSGTKDLAAVDWILDDVGALTNRCDALLDMLASPVKRGVMQLHI